MYSWHLRHQLNNVLSKVWWFCCSFDLRMHPCHFHHYSAWWQPAVLNNSCSLAFIARTQLTDRQVKSYHTVFWEASSGTQRNGSFNKTKTNRNQMLWTNTFPCLNHHESWAAVLTSAIMISLILHWRLIHMSRETAKLYYHYHHPLPLMPVHCGGDNAALSTVCPSSTTGESGTCQCLYRMTNVREIKLLTECAENLSLSTEG